MSRFLVRIVISAMILGTYWAGACHAEKVRFGVLPVLQALLSGQVEAATLTGPLVTAAMAKGATLLADDSGLDVSQTILMFSGPFLKANSREAQSFLKAVNKAAALINTKPDALGKWIDSSSLRTIRVSA
jgi:ABC-type nitrate/sulfonate/bicarbonate transport system substrate-binding protein